MRIHHIAAVHPSNFAAAAPASGKESLSRWANPPRRLSFASIAGYSPGSQVTDRCAIDLDQAAIEDQLALKTPESFANARRIYNEGGNSRSYAQVTLLTPLTSPITKGNFIAGITTDGIEVYGRAYDDYEAGQHVIRVQYATSDLQESYVDCQVGGLTETNLRGCLMERGDLNIGGVQYEYTYDPEEDNNNGRAIAGFSTGAGDKMRLGCRGCPYEDFMYFYNYYGVDDYAHQWVEAAFEGGETTFSKGNADFSLYGLDGRAEAIKKGTAYMNIFMYVIRQFEDALDDCEMNCLNCNDDTVHAWDEGVCFYTGSIEGSDGLTSDGKLLHQLADKMCVNYKTCGAEGGALVGTAKRNHELLNLFTVGNFQILSGECALARETTRFITTKMYVPLIQGAMRYAYKVGELQGGEKGKAEGAAFAAAVLPRVHAASPSAAETIYNNLRVGANSTDLRAVKNAFESVYTDLGISCADVGGLWDGFQGKYYVGMEPCVEAEEPTSNAPVQNPITIKPVSTTTSAPSNPASVPATKPSNLTIPENSIAVLTVSTTPAAPSNSSTKMNYTTIPSIAPSHHVPTLFPVLSPDVALGVSVAPTDDLSLTENSAFQMETGLRVAGAFALYLFFFC